MPSRAYIPKKIEDCSTNGNSSIPDGDTCRADEDKDDILFLFCIILDVVVVDADEDKGVVDDVTLTLWCRW